MTVTIYKAYHYDRLKHYERCEYFFTKKHAVDQANKFIQEYIAIEKKWLDSFPKDVVDNGMCTSCRTFGSDNDSFGWEQIEVNE